MQYRLLYQAQRKRLALFVSKYDHCLYDLLLRQRAGELSGDIAAVISNHPDLEPVAAQFGVPFHMFHKTPETKLEQEQKERALLQALNVDLVVLARYMQVMSASFCEAFSQRIINIHHSFLPAFVGGKPYHQAYVRGVKLIGATAHYATAVLDEGPIIEQDVVRASHRDSVEDLVRKGRDLEKVVLARAVRSHLEDRILVYGNKTVVFDCDARSRNDSGWTQIFSQEGQKGRRRAGWAQIRISLASRHSEPLRRLSMAQRKRRTMVAPQFRPSALLSFL
jgi:formyltetrahydrofolate deformylase